VAASVGAKEVVGATAAAGLGAEACAAAGCAAAEARITAPAAQDQGDRSTVILPCERGHVLPAEAPECSCPPSAGLFHFLV
jgi:hypothetical protein